MESNNTMPMLIPIEQHEFWSQIRQIIKEEIINQLGKKSMMHQWKHQDLPKNRCIK